jgi:hypothetical protein
MTKAFHCFEAQSKQSFDVISLQPAPNITIIFIAYTLQLFKMSQWMMNKRKLK